jgi:hypothetical protein
MPTYSQRAQAIVDRVLPKLPDEPTPHGFYAFGAFVDKAMRHGKHTRARQVLYYRTLARLRAKAEGGKPYLKLPQGSSHLYGPGDALFDVARELELAA